VKLAACEKVRLNIKRPNQIDSFAAFLMLITMSFCAYGQPGPLLDSGMNSGTISSYVIA
jgi:hypothetical protein